MRKLALVFSAVAAIGIALPLATSAQAEQAKVVIKSGDRDNHRDFRRGHREAVVIKRSHDRGHHYGWRNHRDGAKVVVKHGHRDGYRSRAEGSKIIIKNRTRDRD